MRIVLKGVAVWLSLMLISGETPNTCGASFTGTMMTVVEGSGALVIAPSINVRLNVAVSVEEPLIRFAVG